MPIIKSCKVNLYDLIYEKENEENYLRIFIERDDFSMDLDTCVTVSEKISKVLDKYDLIKDDYFLEVASSGIERVLRNKEEYKKAINKYVYILLNEEILKKREYEGILINVEEDKLSLKINKVGKIKILEIPLNKIELIRLSFKF